MPVICETIICEFKQDGAAMIIAAMIGLIGGVLALSGAVWVGLRQAAILREQTELQKGQAKLASRGLELEELKLRTDLFDRRFEVYDAVRAFVSHILTTGTPPAFESVYDHPEEEGIERKVQADFLQAIDRSQFLFRPGVKQRLIDDVWLPASDLHLQNVTLRAAKRTEGEVKAAAADRNRLMQHYGKISSTLSDYFGDELRLGARMPVVGEPIGR